MSRTLIRLAGAAITAAQTTNAAAVPGPPPSGYTLTRVSDAVTSPALSGISQLAFRPGDATHLYAARSWNNVVTRYDLDPSSGALSNPVNVATSLTFPLGLAFRGDDLFVSLNPANDSRITRLQDLDHDGLYEARADFVRGVPNRDHGIDQLQISGATLFAPIGTKWNSGAPTCETVYGGTIARIADLDAIDYAGGANYLASPTEFVNPAPADGTLRRYAHGFRNPFGLRLDGQGGVWVSDNGASFCSVCSACSLFPIDTPDLFYREVPLGARGHFPPDGQPGGGGATLTPLATLATHAAATGFAWITTGPDAGRIVLAQFGTSDPGTPVGRDLVMIDPSSGMVSPFASGFSGPTDVLADGIGRLLIADYDAPAVYLLTPPGILGVDGAPVPGPGARIERLSPNPARGEMAIEYSLPAPGPVRLAVVDIAGREVARLDEGERPAGRSTRRWETPKSLRPGVYLCVIETTGGRTARRFAIVR